MVMGSISVTHCDLTKDVKNGLDCCYARLCDLDSVRNAMANRNTPFTYSAGLMDKGRIMKGLFVCRLRNISLSYPVI